MSAIFLVRTSNQQFDRIAHQDISVRFYKLNFCVFPDTLIHFLRKFWLIFFADVYCRLISKRKHNGKGFLSILIDHFDRRNSLLASKLTSLFHCLTKLHNLWEFVWLLACKAIDKTLMVRRGDLGCSSEVLGYFETASANLIFFTLKLLALKLVQKTFVCVMCTGFYFQVELLFFHDISNFSLRKSFEKQQCIFNRGVG